MSAAARPDRFSPIPNGRVEVFTRPERGRGVFAREPIVAGTVVEAAPVIIVPATECCLLDRTILYNYYFHWDGDPDGEGRGALGLGLVSLCNHASRPRAGSTATLSGIRST